MIENPIESRQTVLSMMLAESRMARLIIAMICLYVLLGAHAIGSLPFMADAPESWMHNPSLIVPAGILLLPVFAFLIITGIGMYYTAASIWCILLFFLFNQIVRMLED